LPTHLSTKVCNPTIKNILLTQRKVVTSKKVLTFIDMSEDKIISPEKCESSLKNVLDALYVLNGRWTLPVVLSLMNKPKRFNEIQKTVSGISPKVLAKELKDLEQNEFVKRNVYPTIPVTILYEATEYSQTLQNVLRELDVWGAQHRERIKQSMRG